MNDANSMLLKAMTFNILGASVRARSQPWSTRAPLCVKVIKEHSPDVLAVQELEPENWATFETELPQYSCQLGPKESYRLVGEQSPSPHNYNAIYWNPERMILIESGGFWLSSTPDRPSQDWGANLVRTANWARFRIRESSAKFLLMNAHLDNKPELARVEAAKLITSRASDLRADDEPTIICGDFNSAPGWPAYTVFAAAGFNDAFLETGSEENIDAFTAHNSRGVKFTPTELGYESSRIDQFWSIGRSGQISPTSYSVVEDGDGDQYPSDHYPVLVSYEIADA